MAGLALSTAYIGWSLLAKGMVEREAQRSLAAIGLGDAPRFSVPMPFNTLLWRVVAMTPNTDTTLAEAVAGAQVVAAQMPGPQAADRFRMAAQHHGAAWMFPARRIQHTRAEK